MTVGVALDVDGTIYRDGSVFVETLPWLAGADWTRPADRAALRQAVTLVAGHHAGRVRATATRGLLSVADVVRATAGDTAGDAALSVLTRLPSPRSDGEGDRKRLRERLLTRYGTAIADRPVDAVERSVARVVGPAPDGQARFRIAEPVAQLISDLRAEGVHVALVTDAPEHVVVPFAETFGGVDSVAGTRYTSRDGMFTGAFERIDKAAVVGRLCDRHGWDRVVAAGDTERDLAMARHAARFVGVAGHGGLRETIAQQTDDDASARTSFVARTDPLASVLRQAVESVRP